MASASGPSMPRAALTSAGSPPVRIECHRLSEPCGSASMMRQRLPSDWPCAARCAVSVLLPAPPLREATVMTFMASSPQGMRFGLQRALNMVNVWLTSGALWRDLKARAPPSPLELKHHQRGNHHRAAGDLQRRENLAEKCRAADRGEQRLEIHEQRGAERADAHGGHVDEQDTECGRHPEGDQRGPAANTGR